MVTGAGADIGRENARRLAREGIAIALLDGAAAEAVVWAKFKSLAEGARIASRRLGIG